MADWHLRDPLDPAFVESENAVVAALTFEVPLEVVLETEELTAVAAVNWIGWGDVGRNSQSDLQAKWTLKLMIEKFRHNRPPDAANVGDLQLNTLAATMTLSNVRSTPGDATTARA